MKSIDECLSAVRRPSSGEFTQAASPPQLPVYSGWQTLPGIAYQSIVPWLPKRGRPAQSGYLSRSLRPPYGSLPVAHLHTLGVHTLQGATGTDIPARRTPRGVRNTGLTLTGFVLILAVTFRFLAGKSPKACCFGRKGNTHVWTTHPPDVRMATCCAIPKRLRHESCASYPLLLLSLLSHPTLLACVSALPV